MARVFVKTLGCKVNTYDSHALESQFRELGYHLSEDHRDADITILNTCSVTHNADREARHLLRRFRRDNPDALVVATGCYAQTDSARLAAMDEVDFVVPNEVKDGLAHFIDDNYQRRTSGQWLPPASKLPGTTKAVSENRQGHFKTSLTLLGAESNRTRAFLKIQDGCDGFCAYCLIPYARGASRSVPQDVILQEIRRQIDTGIGEIILTGIHIGDYGHDLPADETTSLTKLVTTLFSWPDMVRLRISSLEPRELSEELLQILASRREIFCDHFHLPLQAGTDRILKLMRRTYDTSQYAETVAMARRYFPDANFGADVIPGFPGESDEEFAATMAFIQQCGLNYLHVFPYSKRPNTAAARMPGHLAPEVVRARVSQLREMSDQLRQAYARRFIGRAVEVIWEGETDQEGRRLGRAKNYLEVLSPKGVNFSQGQISIAQLKGFVASGKLLGVPIDEPTPYSQQLPH